MVLSPRLAHGFHVEVEESVPVVVVVVVVGCVGVGLDSLVDRGRGVARIDGPGSPPAPPSAAAASAL